MKQLQTTGRNCGNLSPLKALGDRTPDAEILTEYDAPERGFFLALAVQASEIFDDAFQCIQRYVLIKTHAG